MSQGLAGGVAMVIQERDNPLYTCGECAEELQVDTEHEPKTCTDCELMFCSEHIDAHDCAGELWE
ncbi:hypothetical protein LCGC14_2375680 [marine sediment metagenome]|uniref:Uncharacterized protein n=1 Tax=marine sediment metagenome TaxID=412755 RepID=A0A0F9C2G9_9ZZZZ